MQRAAQIDPEAWQYPFPSRTTARRERSYKQAIAELRIQRRDSSAVSDQTQVFRDRLKKLGLSQRDFCSIVGVDVGTASRWGRERAGRSYPFPYWVWLLLDAWDRDPPTGRLVRG